MNRREALALLGGAAAASTGLLDRAQAQAPAGPFTLPPLGYAFEALEPHIDAQTMMIHHGRHHAAFITNLNGLVARWPELATTPIETILADLNKVPEAVRGAVRNNLGGHWNHSFFWDLMKPGGANAPGAELKVAIDGTFGSADNMMEKVNAAGLARFGSGWAWLVIGKDKKLDVVATPYQDTPLELGSKAIAGVDVWEHAYYLKYQNRRADYLKSWWNTVNWTQALDHFRKA